MHWVVVGAGTAGCVVAARLAAGGDHRVTVIERGPDLSGPTTPPAIRSIDYTAALATERNDRDTRATRTTAGDPIAYALGRGVGGSSVINGMVMERGDPSQYDRWGWTDAAEAFERVQVPARRVTGDELGPIDRALEASTSTARRVELSADASGRVTVVDAYLDAVARPGECDPAGGSPGDVVACRGRPGDRRRARRWGRHRGRRGGPVRRSRRYADRAAAIRRSTPLASVSGSPTIRRRRSMFDSTILNPMPRSW